MFDALVGVVSSSGNPLVNAGFHAEHQGSHPLVDLSTGASGFFCLLCIDLNPDPLIIQTNTNSATAVIRHSVPQFAGRIQVKVTITPPSGWSCLTDYNFDFVEEVGVDGLSELEEIGANHEVIRGDIPKHPFGASGTSDALNHLRTFALIYKLLTGNKVSINDLSLPRGGKYDVAAGYNEGGKHIAHRLGRDADFNHLDVAGKDINCFTDVLMQLALATVGATHKLCHTDIGGSYHAQF